MTEPNLEAKGENDPYAGTTEEEDAGGPSPVATIGVTNFFSTSQKVGQKRLGKHRAIHFDSKEESEPDTHCLGCPHHRKLSVLIISRSTNK